MTLGKIYGNVERLEVLTENVELYTLTKSEELTCKKGAALSAVYSYEIQLITSRSSANSYTKEEKVNAQNAIMALFVRYGEKCLNEEFLLAKLQTEYKELDIQGVSFEYVYKHFKKVDSVVENWVSREVTLYDAQKTDNVTI